MKTSGVQTLARVLRVLVIIVFICNIAALVLVPVLAPARAVIHSTSLTLTDLLDSLTAEPPPPGDNWIYFSPGMELFLLIVGGWTEQFGYTLVLTLFLLVFGICTAFILWQGRKVLGTVIAGTPFHADNARCLKRAAVACFVISAAALVRVICNVAAGGSLLSYNTLFIPVFLLSGLLLRVMAALFCQAAELKAENDLII